MAKLIWWQTNEALKVIKPLFKFNFDPANAIKASRCPQITTDLFWDDRVSVCAE